MVKVRRKAWKMGLETVLASALLVPAMVEQVLATVSLVRATVSVAPGMASGSQYRR